MKQLVWKVRKPRQVEHVIRDGGTDYWPKVDLKPTNGRSACPTANSFIPNLNIQLDNWPYKWMSWTGSSYWLAHTATVLQILIDTRNHPASRFVYCKFHTISPPTPQVCEEWRPGDLKPRWVQRRSRSQLLWIRLETLIAAWRGSRWNWWQQNVSESEFDSQMVKTSDCQTSD